MVSVPRGTVGGVTSPPTVTDCPADTDWLESTVAATCGSAPELEKTACPFAARAPPPPARLAAIAMPRLTLLNMWLLSWL